MLKIIILRLPKEIYRQLRIEELMVDLIKNKPPLKLKIKVNIFNIKTKFNCSLLTKLTQTFTVPQNIIRIPETLAG